MSDRAELSSITSSLTELTKRVTALANQASSGEQLAIASDLYDVERALLGALRRLDRIVAAS